MTDGKLSGEEHAALARTFLAYYIGLAHKTDSPEQSGGFAVPRPHHLRIIDRMEQVARIVLKFPGWQDVGSSKHTSVVAPPGSAKTYLLQAYYEWLLGNASIHWGDNWADMFHIGHVSHSADQAWRMSYAVRETIEHNDTFHLCFPKVKPSEKWAEREWRVAGCIGQHPSFVAMGIEGPLLGTRLNILGLDDLIKPEDVKQSKITTTEVEQIIYKVDKVGMKRLVPGGIAWMNHTRWFERDPPAWAVDQGWHEILIPALDENDQSFWESREIFSTENLLLERERDPEGFALQFMGQPAPAEGIIFKADFFSEPYDQVPWTDAEDRMRFLVVDSWDTAGTRNARSDYTAGWTAAIDQRSWDVYLLNLYHDKIEFNDLLDALRGSHASALRPQIVLIEDKSTGQPAAQMLDREGIPVLPLKPFGERGQPRLLDAINQIKPMLATHRVHFPSERFALAHGLGWVGQALGALLMYPRATHDDIPRALIQLLYWTLQYQKDAGVYDPQQDDLSWGTPQGKRVRV